MEETAKIKDLEFLLDLISGSDDELYYHKSQSWGTIIVLRRLTGYGYIDIETSFRAPDGKFWLASGDFDIRRFPEMTIGEAIEHIKENANVCVGI